MPFLGSPQAQNPQVAEFVRKWSLDEASDALEHGGLMGDHWRSLAITAVVRRDSIADHHKWFVGIPLITCGGKIC